MNELAKIAGSLLAALLIQVLLTRSLEYFYFLDLPLVAVIYFASYRTRVEASLIGSLTGLLQDSICGLPLGMNGFTKTLIGYIGAVVCGRLLLETYGAQFLLLFAMSLLDSAIILALRQMTELAFSGRILNALLLQPIATAAVGAGVISLAHFASRWKSKS